jgi:hypothetical protein
MEPSKRLQAAIIQVVQNQIDANDPPETKRTLMRLMTEGYSEAAAKELLGTVVVAEVLEVLQRGQSFDLERYVGALKRLSKPH